MASFTPSWIIHRWPATSRTRKGRIVYYNQRWADCYSISRHAWLGKTEAELWPEETASRAARA